ncbi:MAG: flagellar biosynthetic protein FliO [Archangium sp.]|nr:flagellar biosynthetic protein FliO [Archangium sp.]
MLALIITALVAATPVAAEGSAPDKPPAPPSAADTVVAAAFNKDIGTKPAELKVEPSFSAQNLLAPGLAIAGLAALAFTLKRRKQLSGGSIHIVEAASLGEKRSLVIADVLGERLVLGVSEAGVTVLMNRPAPQPEPAPYVVPAAVAAPAMGFFQRLKGKSPARAFDASLLESIEDQELRAKLAAGMRGVVP